MNKNLEAIKKLLATMSHKMTSEELSVALGSALILLAKELKRLNDLKGEDGKTPTEKELRDMILPLIPPSVKGDDGKDYVLTLKDKKEIAASIKVPVAEKIIERTETVKEQPIITEIVKEVAIPEKAEIIRDKLESLKDDERLDKSAIKGLEEGIAELRGLIAAVPRGGRALGMRKVPIIKRYSLTSQVNGSARSFTVPNDTVEILGIWGTQHPITFDTADWTFVGNTITLANTVSTPQAGQTLHAIIETLFYG